MDVASRLMPTRSLAATAPGSGDVREQLRHASSLLEAEVEGMRDVPADLVVWSLHVLNELHRIADEDAEPRVAADEVRVWREELLAAFGGWKVEVGTLLSTPRRRRQRERAVALARQCVGAVSEDLRRTAGVRATFEILWDEEIEGIRIETPWGWESPSMTTEAPEDALAEVADYVQHQFTTRDPFSTWPVCSEHEAGLHAEVREGRAVWRCRVGQHPVADVGNLPPST
jgi:hypothetical protein